MDLTYIISELRAELGELLDIIRTVETLAYGKPVTKHPIHPRKPEALHRLTDDAPIEADRKGMGTRV